MVDENQINVVQYLSENHFWLGKDEAVGKIAIVDFEIRKTRILNQTEFLQSLFHAPMKEENVTQWTDLKGCCTTVILLVVWLCHAQESISAQPAGDVGGSGQGVSASRFGGLIGTRADAARFPSVPQ